MATTNSDGGGTANQYQQAVDNYRSTLKWVLATFGAVGGALIVGLQLTSLGALHGEKLFWAIVSAVVAMFAVAAVVVLAAFALIPVGGSYQDFQHSPVFAKLREKVPWIGGGPPSPLLREQATNLQDLVAKNKSASGQQLSNVQTVTGDLTNLGIMLRVEQLFRRTLVAAAIAVPLVAGGAVAYAYLSDPLDPTKTVDCTTYYTNLHTLATDSPSLVTALQQNNAPPLPIKIDAQSRACGVDSNAELAQLLKVLK